MPLIDALEGLAGGLDYRRAAHLRCKREKELLDAQLMPEGRHLDQGAASAERF